MPHHEANFTQLWLRHLTGDTGMKTEGGATISSPGKEGKGIIYLVPSILYALYLSFNGHFNTIMTQEILTHFDKYNNEVEMTWTLESNKPTFKIWISLLTVLRNTFKFFQSIRH